MMMEVISCMMMDTYGNCRPHTITSSQKFGTGSSTVGQGNVTQADVPDYRNSDQNEVIDSVRKSANTANILSGVSADNILSGASADNILSDASANITSPETVAILIVPAEAEEMEAVYRYTNTENGLEIEDCPKSMEETIKLQSRDTSVIANTENHAFHTEETNALQLNPSTLMIEAKTNGLPDGETRVSKGGLLGAIHKGENAAYQGEKPENELACEFCERKFMLLVDLCDHMKEHKENPLTCELCKKQFIEKCHLFVHMQQHKSQRPFICKHCCKGFRGKKMYRRHVAAHRKRATHNMHNGKLKSKGSTHLHNGKLKSKGSTHKMHNGKLKSKGSKDIVKQVGSALSTRSRCKEKNHACNICGQRFARKCKLVVHINVHEEEYLKKKDDPALNCEETDASNKEETLENSEGEQKEEQDICDESQMKPKYKRRLKQSHKGLFENDIVFPLSCNVCNKVFDKRNAFRRHVKQHLQEKQFICEHCGKGFVSKRNLTLHLSTHYGVRDHICEECGLSFSRADTLYRHRKVVHSGEGCFICQFCGSAFKRNSTLVNHLRLHTGETPFTCGNCGERFINKKRLKTHLLSHMQVKPVQCQDCGTTFTRAESLSKHHKKLRCKAIYNRVSSSD